MARFRVRIDGDRVLNLGFTDFVTRKQAHVHLFKHVVRVSGLREDELTSTADPEEWSTEIPEPPLAGKLPARREQALAALREVESCRLGREGPTTEKPCNYCGDKRARSRVDKAFSDLLGAYVAAAHRVLRWSLENPARSKPRMLTYTDPLRDSVRIEVTDTGGNRAIGALDKGSDEIAIVSCYRSPKRRPYRAVWQDICREQAGHRREGTAVSIELMPAEGAS